ncbi:MAG TPA: F0F1 ATP synthase subunit gamma, partial [Rhodocyclaceae bacterium]|nr:F0F1 ATP synthase subunit gamma [Rhodocyclaceae bacterium]
MSDTMLGLRRKIGSAGDLQSVVRTMKALAAASVGQYEQSVRALGDYTRSVELGLGACLRDGERSARNADTTAAADTG